MKALLLDENVPSRLRFVPTLPVIATRAVLGEGAPDSRVWEFAKENSHVILTKDTDYSDLVLAEGPPPWVVHLRFGNMPRREFHALLSRLWTRVESLLPEHKLIRVYEDRIEAVK